MFVSMGGVCGMSHVALSCCCICGGGGGSACCCGCGCEVDGDEAADDGAEVEGDDCSAPATTALTTEAPPAVPLAKLLELVGP